MGIGWPSILNLPNTRQTQTMRSLIIVALIAFMAMAAEAFTPSGPAVGVNRLAAAVKPQQFRSAVQPTQMHVELIEPLTTTLTLAGEGLGIQNARGLEVTTAAFLANILGVGIPTAFLVTLYAISEAKGEGKTFRD